MRPYLPLCVFLTLFSSVTAGESAPVLAQLAQAESRLPALRAALSAAASRGLDIAYPRADIEIAALFVEYGRQDVAQGRLARAAEVAQEIEMLLDRAAREMEADRRVPRIGQGPLEIRDGAFWAECETADGAQFQPVFFTGYGHFDQVVEDLPVLGKIGVNIIQVEQGPAGVVLEDGINTAPITTRVLGALDRAAENGVRIALLLSPHYFPAWAFEKWPELKIDVGPGHVPPFLKNSVEAAQARDIYERYLRVIIPMIKDHPALHSICLSNEPAYAHGDKDPWRKAMWTAYLQERYQRIEELNECYGAEYADFESVSHPEFNFRENKAMLYDAIRFNQRHFAAWHRWMVDIIHEMAPGLPCHAKVMPVFWGRFTIFWGTDPWDFAQLSQINGNDCNFGPIPRNKSWKSLWQVQNMYYDLQRSMKNVPVINTENHIIPDRHQEYVSPEHIYTAIWQGAAHGQGASATWAWARTYDSKSDFEGLILHRAACTAAMSRAALDLMRLAPEMTAIQNLTPRVALLFSNSAQVHDTRFVGEIERVYEALNFCGVPIGFVTEEQAAAGGLESYDCLIVTGSRTVLREAADAIRAFQARGGRLISLGAGNMIEDEYGRPVTPVRADVVIEGRPKQETLRDKLIPELAKAGIAPEILLRTPEGKAAFGVEWRSVSCQDTVLLNAVNLTPNTIHVTLPDGEWRELINNTAERGRIELAPNTPKLLKKTL